jgi:ABC-type nickel/cobalt efflux system permease component RcnA
MNGLLIGLAEMNPEDLPGVKGWPANGQLDVFVVIGAVALIILLALIWAVAIRKPRRRHHRHHHHHHPESHQWGMNQDADLEDEAGPDEKPAETRRRRRRREHRSRNPTLAETGGLPPIRGEKPPGDSPA